MNPEPLLKGYAKGRILLLDTAPESLKVCQALLAKEGYHAVVAENWPAARELLRREAIDVVVTDLQPGDGGGGETVAAILAEKDRVEVLVTVPGEKREAGVDALRSGASAILFRPLHLGELSLQIGRTVFRLAQQTEVARLTGENNEFLGTVTAFHKCMAFLRIRDVDRLGDLVLDTLMELVSAESAVLWLAGVTQEGLRLRSRRGLAQVAAASEELHPDLPEYVFVQADRPVLDQDGKLLYTPLRCGGDLVGLIKAELPSERNAFDQGELAMATMVGEFAASALLSLIQVHRSEHDLLRTPGGEAYNMTFFRDHLEKELLAAQRYGRHLALIKLVIDNHQDLVARFHDRHVADEMRKIVAAVTTVLRDADIISQSAPGVYYMLLPETDPWGALMAQRRIRKAIRSYLLISDLKKNMPIRVSMRSASCPGDGPTLAALDAVMESRLAVLRRSILLRGRFDDAPFWQVIAALLGEDPRTPTTLFEEEEGGRYFSIGAQELEELCGMVCREVLEMQQGRGMALRGCRDFEAARQAMDLTTGRLERGVSVYLIGGENPVEIAEAGVFPVPIDDPVFNDKTFLLCIGEDFAYALVARRDGERWRAFHTADVYFVENMLAKLQEQYQLQTQI